uniref:Calreticulin 3 n=1 Tax=Falco tinnunculus TaxID=100819 RepID=A0A8C4TTG7_FALTI
MAVAGQRGRGGGAPAGVALKVALRLGVALRSVRAAVYFQEQFLDGGWAGVGVSGGRWDGHWLRRCFDYYTNISTGPQTSENAKFYAVSHDLNHLVTKGRLWSFSTLRNMSTYNLFVRPNICGSETKKVHVILNHKNKHHPIKKPIRCKADRYTHLYTLIIRPDQTYNVKIDNKMVASGNLEDDFDFLPPRKVNDPTVRKPIDWDDRMQIDDPEDIKPEDWDEAEFITDTSAEKPEDPRCSMDNTLSNFSFYENISIIGLDIWQVRSGTIFNNFLVIDDKAYAEDFGYETWGETKIEEEQEQERVIEEKYLEQQFKKKLERKKESGKDRAVRNTIEKEF